MNKWDCRKDIMYLIRHLAKLLDADFDRRVAEIGLTGSQTRVLFYINRKTQIEHLEVHQNDIEREFRLAKSTVNGLVSRLLKTGYIIKRNVHPYAVIEMSETGINALSKLRDGRIETVNKLFKGYTPEEQERVLEKLNMLIQNLEGGSEDVSKDKINS